MKRRATAILALALLIVLWVWLARRGERARVPEPLPTTDRAPTTIDAAASDVREGTVVRVPRDATTANVPVLVAPAANRTFARVHWGSAPDQLGHERPAEGAPEAPMSLAQDPSGNVVVLDQTNHRLVRFDANGHATGTQPLRVTAPQDVAIARDGSIAVLDRLGDRAVALLGADGRVRGELPLVGRGIPEGGGTTGVFIDGDDVYVEREHATLVRIGTVDGRADADRSEIQGRPSRDGASLLRAGIADASAGRYSVTSIVRSTGQPRFTRTLALDDALRGIVLLETDRSGVVYVAIEHAPRGASVDDPHATGVRLTCLDASDGRTLGTASLPASRSPDETFRSLIVLDGGGVLEAIPDDDGETIARYDCQP